RRQLAEAGVHVLMAVRNTKAAQELIQQWRNEWSGKGLPLNVEKLVMCRYKVLELVMKKLLNQTDTAEFVAAFAGI
ncbi:unnamed protein product, partial [Brassica rapa]